MTFAISQVHFINPPMQMSSILSAAKPNEIYFDASVQCVFAGDLIIPVSNIRSMKKWPVTAESTAEPEPTELATKPKRRK